MSPTRRRLVSQAIEAWQKQLTDLGGRNTLLYFRDLRRGTLTLPPGAQTGGLLGGRRIRLSTLFPDPDALRDAARRARTIHAKSRENDEERGLQTLYLAYGLAAWSSDRSSATPNAPVLLYRLALNPDGARAEDFRLQTDGEPEINPALLRLLEADYGVSIDPDGLLGATGAESPAAREDVLRRLTEACAPVPDFAIAPRAVVGNFSYAKLPMVRDLERALDMIAEHPLLAAIAGDTGARDELRERHAAFSGDPGPPVPPPADEYLVLDADSSQSRVIAAAVAGADLVVIGPPGTGKSQTIANLIATLVARGRSVLFVAEKRAAIEAVSKRLVQHELGDLLLDMHDGAANRRRLYGELGRALDVARETLAPDVADVHRTLVRTRATLEEYTDQLHAPAEPWGVCVFEAQERLLGIGEPSRIAVRLRGKALEELTQDVVEQAGEDLRRFVELGGPSLTAGGAHPWAAVYAAGRVTSTAHSGAVLDMLSELHLDALPELREATGTLCEDRGLRYPATLNDTDALIGLCENVAGLFGDCRPSVFGLDLDGIAAALAPASGGPSRVWAALFNSRYRQARTALREHALWPSVPDGALLRLADGARLARDQWRDMSADGRLPEGPPDARALRAAYERAVELLRRLGEATDIPANEAQPLERLEEELANLQRERTMLMRFPELHRREGNLRDRRLGSVIDGVTDRGLSADEAAAALEHVWLTSILDRIALRQQALATFDGEAQTSAADLFRETDRQHIATGKKRVKRAWAEGAVRARDDFPDQAGLVSAQAHRKRGHMPIRTLFDRAASVLTAVKPCWVMSPLVVAQVLPPHPCFDVVVFDEASQILPADAVSSLLRGRRAIVAGDPHQLPPTTFFLSGPDADEETDDAGFEDQDPTDEQQAALRTGQDLSLASDQESILEVMRALLPPPHGTRTLSWHYRSLDERLITFSNAQENLYAWSLTTFPGAHDDESLRHVPVPFRPGAHRVTASNPDEVKRVVELVLEHARTRSEETLGVIALGVGHADAIGEALRLARGEHPDIEQFWSEGHDEPPFVKNLERVQGDERDAIILTIGYSKNLDGQMRYQFGPVNREGGERRLNVAVTRARRRMTVVSSFDGQEMDPERLRQGGPRMLRDYLLYAASDGEDLGVRAREKPALTPFERDVREQLEGRGVPLVPQYGASGYWIDFAAMHPERRSKPVLAIEADGASYHSSPTARDRDRLRQEHLERLGWRFHRIWSTEWFRQREREVKRAVEAWKQAVQAEQREAPPENGADQPQTPAGAEPPAPPQQSPPKRNPWPGVPRGQSITAYEQADLRKVIRWVCSDGRLHTEDELLADVMTALGFKRRGSRIEGAIRQAIAVERKATGSSEPLP